MAEEQLHDKWKELIAAIEHECQEHHQDPGVLDVDESRLKVSLPLDDGRFPQYFKEDEVLRGHLRELAHAFYKDYRSVRSQEQAGGG